MTSGVMWGRTQDLEEQPWGTYVLLDISEQTPHLPGPWCSLQERGPWILTGPADLHLGRRQTPCGPTGPRPAAHGARRSYWLGCHRADGGV